MLAAFGQCRGPVRQTAHESHQLSLFGQIKAFSSEVATGSREENASNQNHRVPLLIPSEAGKL
jgi:hypothetical protein